MWIVVTEIVYSMQNGHYVKRGEEQNFLNTDYVERVHRNGDGGLTVIFRNKYMDIKEDWNWWLTQEIK